MTNHTTMRWQDRAACADLHPDLFFSEIPADVVAAQAICATCPVITECGEWATTTNQEHGVWGGILRSENLRPLKHGDYTSYVRGCHRDDCSPDGGCLGAKRRYAAGARARAKEKKMKAAARA